jgi:hypothetical protein
VYGREPMRWKLIAINFEVFTVPSLVRYISDHRDNAKRLVRAAPDVLPLEEAEDNEVAHDACPAVKSVMMR